jgi:flavin reductase (DIM6/NTAB) family NADH-FMN oxidoreductase RutF
MSMTATGIRENQTFSVNIPSVDIVKETDYCGLVSGKNQDKSQVFECFIKLGGLMNILCIISSTQDPLHIQSSSIVIGSFKCLRILPS